MNLKQYASLLMAAIFATATAEAQTDMLTLDDCRNMAIENNAKIKTAKASVSQARYAKKEAFTNYLPTVNLTGGAMKANEGLLQMDMGPEQSLELIDEGVFGGVTASLPLFAGGRIVNGNKLAKVGEEVSALQLKQTENEVLLTVEQYYWQIVILAEKLNTVKKVEELLERIGKDVDVAVNAGLTNRNDLLQVNLRKNDIKSSKIHLESMLELSKTLLAQYIGMGNQPISIATTFSEAPVPPSSFQTNHSEALFATPEHQLLGKGVEAAKLQKRMTIGEHLPTVGLGGAYLHHDFMGSSQKPLIGFVSVSIPISWKAPFSVKKQKLNCQIAQTNYNDGAEMLLIRMQKTWSDFEDAYEQALIAQESIEQAKENLRLNEDYYKVGTSSMSELLDAQVLYQQSCDKYVEMMANYEIKKMEYLQATGR